MDIFIEEYKYTLDFGPPAAQPVWYGQSTTVVAAYGNTQLCVTRDYRVFTWDGREMAVLAPEVPLRAWSAAADDTIARLAAGVGRPSYRYFKKLCSALVALRMIDLQN